MLALAKSLTVDNVIEVLTLFAANGCEEHGVEDYAYRCGHFCAVSFDASLTYTAESTIPLTTEMLAEFDSA